MTIDVAINERCPPDPRDRFAWLTSGPEVDIFAGTPEVEMFLEETYTTRESLRGSATPRRRPRRVAKKLAARGWRVHFDDGKRLPSEQVSAFCYAILGAALGYNNRGRLVARQTSYRPLRKVKRR